MGGVRRQKVGGELLVGLIDHFRSIVHFFLAFTLNEIERKI